MERHTTNGWTIETVLSHVLSLIEARYNATAARIDAVEQRLTERLNVADRNLHNTMVAQKESVLTAIAASDRAVTKAEISAEKRFESVNEFRNTLSDQQRNLMPRAEVAEVVNGLREKIAALEKQMDNFHSERQGLRGGWGFAVGVVGLVLTLITIATVVLSTIRE
jgi:hypothetical protein